MREPGRSGDRVSRDGGGLPRRRRRQVSSRVKPAAEWFRESLRRAVCFSCGVALAAACATPAGAQSTGDSVIVSVLTMGPGEELFERFGHDALRIHDLRTGFDSAYNWGMFTFEQPHFLQRFLTGDTRYWVEAFPAPFLIRYYRGAGRAVIEQDSSMTRRRTHPASGPSSGTCVPRTGSTATTTIATTARHDYATRSTAYSAAGSAARRSRASTAAGLQRDLAARGGVSVAERRHGTALGPRADATLSAWTRPLCRCAFAIFFAR